MRNSFYDRWGSREVGSYYEHGECVQTIGSEATKREWGDALQRSYDRDI